MEEHALPLIFPKAPLVCIAIAPMKSGKNLFTSKNKIRPVYLCIIYKCYTFHSLDIVQADLIG